MDINTLKTQNEPLDAENLDNRYFFEAFPDFVSFAELYRATYKYTSCGPSLGVTVTYRKTVESDGFNDLPFDQQVTETLYCSELEKLGTWEDMDNAGILAVSLCVSSIVEGVDQCTATHEVEVQQLDETPSEFAHRFYSTVDAVNTEANDIWHETHGCETCAQHWDVDFDENFGQIPVWTECPNCGGFGTVI